MEFKTKPWAHQLKTSKYLNEERVEPYYGLLWDMGTGKTKQACDILRIACFQKNAVPYTLIICPVVVLENWKREIKLHTNIPITTVAVIDGITKIDGKKNKNPTKTLKLKQLEQTGKQIFIISTETVDGKTGSIWQELIKLPIEMLIIDEVHNIRVMQNNKESKKIGNLLMRVCEHADNIRLLLLIITYFGRLKN